MNNRILFALWGGLFVLCAALGFLPETNGWMTAVSVVFFLPPALLLYDAHKNRDLHTAKLIRTLSGLSLGLTVLLLVLNLLTAMQSEFLGSVLHYTLTIVSSPMICSGHWAMSLFLWACLLMVSGKQIKR